LGITHNQNFETIKTRYFNEFPDHVLLPTQSLLQKWLREKHEIILFISPIGSKPVKYLAVIPHCYVKKDIKGLGTFDSYEQALEAALQQALNIIP
jgi:hypothetical protein